jgi:hypothetical protein
MFNLIETMYKQAQLDIQTGNQQKVYPAKQQSTQPNAFVKKMNYTNKGKVKPIKTGELKLNSPYNER